LTFVQDADAASLFKDVKEGLISDGYFWVRMFENWIKRCAHHIAATSENGFIEGQGLWREDLYCLSLPLLDGTYFCK